MRIQINIARQEMKVLEHQILRKTYAISSATNGVGENFGSECTPRGKHIIRAKMGADAKVNTVFIARRPSGEIYSPELRLQHPDRDWVLSRILWLSGTELGLNRLGNTDTMQRYIYIHGTPDDINMGQAGSRGCIRMRNVDIIELFDWTAVGTAVDIVMQ